MQFLTIFLGAFLGTASAFALEAYRRYRRQKDRQLEAVLAAESVLLIQWNSLLSFLQKAPDGQNPLANLKHIILNFSHQAIDFSNLAFLGASEDPQLMLELDVAQESYLNAVNTAELRNVIRGKFFNHPDTKLRATIKNSARYTLLGTLGYRTS